MSKTSMKKTRRASRTEKTTQWKSWGETPSSCEVPNGQNMGEWEAATNRHRRLVQRRVRAIEAMLPMKNRKDQALAHHILAWLSYILSRRLSSSQVARDWAEKALKLDPTNDFTWSLLSGLYFFASHYVGYAEPGAAEIRDAFGDVTPLKGARNERCRTRVLVMKALASKSIVYAREALKRVPDSHRYERWLRSAITQMNAAERRLARSERRPAEVIPMKTTGWKERLLA